MPITYTKEQQSVIDIRGKNILVSAAAGSGKTAVLVERIIKIISDTENPLDIDRLLVLTFTNLAALEMRERIGHSIGKKLEQDPENTHLQKQMTLLHNAQITTIDSFCLFILRNHFHAIDLDPGFRIADEGELKLLKKEVMGSLLEDWYENVERKALSTENADFLNCVEYFTTGSNDSILEEYIEKLYHTAMSFPWPSDWLYDRKKDYAVDSPEALNNLPWMEYLLDYTEKTISGCICELEKALRICAEPDGPYMYLELLEKELQVLFNLSPLHARTNPQMRYELKAAESIPSFPPVTFTDYISCFETISFARLPVKKDDMVAQDKREQVKNLRNMVKQAITSLREEYFTLPPDQIALRMAQTQPAVATLVDLVLDYKNRFDQAKREKNIIDFSDMEHFALDILWEKSAMGLKPSAVAKELKKHFVTVMTDEYQDSNQVQELLLESISSEDEGRYNRFMVGDVKQSIYKFRLARPEIFMEKYDQYPLLAASSCDPEPSPNLRIDLNQNFRSRTNVLAAANYIFGKIMQKTLGGIEYDERAALYPGAAYPENGTENQTELMLLDISEETEDEPLTAEFLTDSKKELEARMIAQRIREMVNCFKVTDQKTGLLRPLSYRDIVILLRTTKDWDEVFKKVLNEEGIPAITGARTGYFATSEIQTILQLIAVLDNPLQDIPLFGVMKSFFGEFHDEEIAVIKTFSVNAIASAEANDGSKRIGLYEQLSCFAKQNTKDGKAEEAVESKRLGDKADEFLAFIQRYRNKAIYTPIADLLKELVIDSGYYHYVAVRPDGEQRSANLEMLLKKAASFAATSYHGLFHFVRYIEQLEKYDVDYGEANILDEQADVVRLMSIHKSKGLEFPVCFVAGLHKRINMMDSHGVLCLDVDFGLGVDSIDSVNRVRRKSLRKSIISQKIKLDSLGEELRILYVAMTRAKEKLILSGVTKKITPGERKAESRPSFLNLTASNNFLDLLMPLIQAEDAKDIFAIRIYAVGDLVSETVNEMIDLNYKRDTLLARLKEGQPTSYQKANGGCSLREKVTQVSEKFARPYPHANLSGLYAKTTVSELKRAGSKMGEPEVELANCLLFEEPEVVPYIPQFMKEDVEESAISSGSERGSAYHKVMELISYKDLQGFLTGNCIGQQKELEARIIDQISHAVKDGRLSVAYQEAVPIHKVSAFFTSGNGLSPLAARMVIADQMGQLHKEQPFVIGINANRLSPDLPPAEMILIQGIIDVFFEEEDGLVILDYKSDAVKNKDELITRYEKQLEYYQEALTQLTGKKVKERLIYSFALGEVVELG